MGIKFGEVDSDQILENEFRVGVLEALIQLIINKNNISLQAPTSQEVDEIREKIVKKLQDKYPNSGISWNKPRGQ